MFITFTALSYSSLSCDDPSFGRIIHYCLNKFRWYDLGFALTEEMANRSYSELTTLKSLRAQSSRLPIPLKTSDTNGKELVFNYKVRGKSLHKTIIICDI